MKSGKMIEMRSGFAWGRAIANEEKLPQMPKKKYIVTLTDQERSSLEDLTKKGKSPAYKVNHARILLLADTNRSEGGWSDQDISQALKISVATIERVRQRLVEQGLEAALGRKTAQNQRPRRLDGKQEAYLIAMTCSSPPKRARTLDVEDASGADGGIRVCGDIVP